MEQTHPSQEAQKLEPCPFCGAEPKVTERPESGSYHRFVCFIACYCGGYSSTAHQMGGGQTQAEASANATTAWNTRALLRSQQPVSGGERELVGQRSVLADWVAQALRVFDTLDPDDCEDGGTELRSLITAGTELVRAVRVDTPLRPAARLSSPQAVGHLSRDELDLCRQWFDVVQDVNGGYLNKADYMLAERLYAACGMRVPSSISNMYAPPTQQGDSN